MMNTLFYKQNKWKDPFAEPSVPPSHYHPSPQKTLSANNKQTRIQASTTDHTKQQKFKNTTECEKVSPKQKQFLDKGHSYITRELPTHDTPSPANNSSKFDESWPSSERPSTVDSPHDLSGYVVNDNEASGAPNKLSSLAYSKSVPPEKNAWSVASSLAESRHSRVNLSGASVVQRSMQGLPTSSQSTARSSRSTVRKKPEGSTIAKYIERFRYGEPSSREVREREKISRKAQDFWWLQSDSSANQSSTPTDVDSQISRRIPTRLASSPMKASSGSKASEIHYESDSSSFLAPDSADRRTTDIQQRANALIERSESSFTNDTSINSEPSNLFPSQPQPPVLRHIPTNVPTQYTKSMPGGFKRVTRNTAPEDDILYQWRLRRKLEQARDKSAKFTGPLSGLSCVTNIKPQQQFERSSQDVDSKLSEFRERLKRQEQLSTVVSHPVENKTSFGLPDVKNEGNDPIPQTIATQTNGRLDERPELDQYHDNESRIEANFAQANINRDALSVRISSPKHSHPLRSQQGVEPHLHMSCDIIPCHDAEHHEGIRGQNQDDLQNQYLRVKPQKLDFSDYEEEQRKSAPIDTYDHIGKREGRTLHEVEQEQTMAMVKEAKIQAREKSVDKEPENTSVKAASRPSQICRRSPISSTIGKVVSDRLFSTPQQSVSPSSSPPSMHSVAVEEDPGSNVLQEVEISDDNSSGEFSDDDLLQVLRQKRETFEEELRQIDQRLAEFEN